MWVSSCPPCIVLIAMKKMLVHDVIAGRRVRVVAGVVFVECAAQLEDSAKILE